MINSCNDCRWCHTVRYDGKNTYYCRAKLLRGVLLVRTRVTIDWRDCKLAEERTKM